MAQSLAPRSRTDNLNQMVDNRSTESSAGNGLNSMVSAGVSATVQAELNASVSDEHPLAPDAHGKRSPLFKNPCGGPETAPNLNALVKGARSSGKDEYLSRTYNPRRFQQHCPLKETERLKEIGNGPAAKAAAAVRSYHGYHDFGTLGGQLQAGKNKAGVRARIAGGGTDFGSRDTGDRGGSYSTGFPDSTQGTALVSPPDMGAVSPLEWKPSMDFGLRDFTETQFLRPSLHAGRRGDRGGRERANIFGRQRLFHSSLVNKPEVDSPETNLPSDQTSVPSIDPSLLSPIDQP